MRAQWLRMSNAQGEQDAPAAPARVRTRQIKGSPTAVRACQRYPLGQEHLRPDHRRRAGRTLAAASTLDKDLKAAKTGADTAAAAAVGKLIAERAAKAGVKEVVFDRGAYIYHGRVKALADAAREGGLNF